MTPINNVSQIVNRLNAYQAPGAPQPLSDEQRRIIGDIIRQIKTYLILYPNRADTITALFSVDSNVTLNDLFAAPQGSPLHSILEQATHPPNAPYTTNPLRMSLYFLHGTNEGTDHEGRNLTLRQIASAINMMDPQLASQLFLPGAAPPPPRPIGRGLEGGVQVLQLIANYRHGQPLPPGMLVPPTIPQRNAAAEMLTQFEQHPNDALLSQVLTEIGDQPTALDQFHEALLQCNRVANHEPLLPRVTPAPRPILPTSEPPFIVEPPSQPTQVQLTAEQRSTIRLLALNIDDLARNTPNKKPPISNLFSQYANTSLGDFFDNPSIQSSSSVTSVDSYVLSILRILRNQNPNLTFSQVAGQINALASQPNGPRLATVPTQPTSPPLIVQAPAPGPAPAARVASAPVQGQPQTQTLAGGPPSSQPVLNPQPQYVVQQAQQGWQTPVPQAPSFTAFQPSQRMVGSYQPQSRPYTLSPYQIASVQLAYYYYYQSIYEAILSSYRSRYWSPGGPSLPNQWIV